MLVVVQFSRDALSKANDSVFSGDDLTDNGTAANIVAELTVLQLCSAFSSSVLL